MAEQAGLAALKRFLVEDARRLGFDAVRVTAAAADPVHGERLGTFLAEGRHGEMAWLAETGERRASPQALWPQARSVVVLAMNYGPAEDPLELLSQPDRGSISVYARGRDYHELFKGKLKELASRLLARAGEGHEVKVFVDTAPVMEKPLAEAAGLGWQGKHTNLVSRAHGSWLFLGSIFTTLELEPDRPETTRCGSCRACLDICPTSAFPAPFQLDARRCLSYLTIELKGLVPGEFRKPMGNRIYGCDDCLAVCPWNKFAAEAREAKLQAREDLKAPALAELLALDDAAFRARFSGSPVKRIGRAKFVSNCLIAAGNSGETGLLAAVRLCLTDPSPIVRGAAAWALGELAPAEAAMKRSSALEVEADPLVREEWHAIPPARPAESRPHG